MAHEAHATGELAPGVLPGGELRLVSEVHTEAADAVWEAEDATGRKVLVRFLAPAADPGRALAAAARLAGPHVLPFVGGGCDGPGGRAYLVLPRLPGRTLESILQLQGPLVPTVAVRLLRQAAAGVEEAHGAGLLHQGLDPAWIHLCEQEGQVTAKVSGFGLPPPAPAGRNLPLYLAPEQLDLSGGVVDGRADVWALGAVLYAALSGAPPLARVRDAGELRAALASSSLPALQEVAPWIPAPLAEIVHALLIHDRDARCPSVREAARLLERAGGTARVVPAMLGAPTSEQLERRAAPARLPRRWSELAARAASPRAHDPMIGATLAGRYTITGVVGRGAIATVYEAAGAAGERVAIKVVHAGDGRGGGTLDLPSAQRLLREARAARTIDSPHVVRVFEVDTDAATGKLYIRMELLHGRDLRRLVEEVGSLDPAVAVRLALQACQGLGAAHARGIIHRDIKPANLFVHEEDERVTVKVCDFGTAKLLEGAVSGQITQLTATGSFLGSPRYMSPEQTRDPRAADARSDLWSLAASLYEALAGRAIWPETAVADVVRAIQSRDVAPLASVAPWIDPALAVVVHGALQRHASARPQTVAELAAALAPFAGGSALLRRADLARR